MKDKIVRLKDNTVKKLNEVNRLRTKEAVKDKKFFDKLINGVRGLWTVNEEVDFLADYFLRNRKKKK